MLLLHRQQQRIAVRAVDGDAQRHSPRDRAIQPELHGVDSAASRHRERTTRDLLSAPLMVPRSVTVPVIEPSSRNCTASIPQRPATANACSAAMAAWPTCTVTASTME